jgi:hypothetical protein
MGRPKRKRRRPLRREDRAVREQIEIYERMLGVLAKQIQDAGTKVVAMAAELRRIKHVALTSEGDDG